MHEGRVRGHCENHRTMPQEQLYYFQSNWRRASIPQETRPEMHRKRPTLVWARKRVTKEVKVVWGATQFLLRVASHQHHLQHRTSTTSGPIQDGGENLRYVQ
jgi:hypothetical protein